MDKHGGNWDWHQEKCIPRNNSTFDIPDLCNGVSTNREDLSYMYDETATPSRACGDYVYHVADNENVVNEPEEHRQTSLQAKRRRTLQFDNTDTDPLLCSEEISSVFPKSTEVDYSVEDMLPEVSQWLNGFTDDVPVSLYEGLDLSTEGWLEECFNDVELNFGPDDMNYSGASDVQFATSEYCNIPPENEVNMVQQRSTGTPRKIVLKGRTSYISTPTKLSSPIGHPFSYIKPTTLSSSVAYPFSYLKPCEVRGDVTLKDINQRISTPPPSKSKQPIEPCYQTSAFSGKLVVAKTKIHTEGGKGSITIMRTKG